MFGKKVTSAAVIVGLLAASVSTSALADGNYRHGSGNGANVAAAVLGAVVIGSLVANATRPTYVSQPVYQSQPQTVYYDAPQAQTTYYDNAPQTTYYAQPQTTYYAQPQPTYYAQPQAVYYAPQPVYYAQPAVSVSYGYNGGYRHGGYYHHR